MDKERDTEDEFERSLYGHDMAPLPKEMELAFKTKPDRVVRPKTEDDVVEIVQDAFRRRKPIVPRGAATWGLGGAVPVKGGIVVDLSTMDKILKIDEENMLAVVQAGITWKKLYDALLKKRLFLGAYPSSAPAATVGGWINTGGVGTGTYKYGSAADMIRSMNVVLPNGELIKTGFDNVLSNSTGYNLTQLFIASEGTLGIVTQVTFKVLPAPDEIRPLSYSFSDIKAMGNAMKALRKTRAIPLHVWFGDRLHYGYLKAIGKEAPDVGALLNVALEGQKDIVDLEQKIVDSVMEKSNGKKESKELAEHEWEERSYEFRMRKMGIGTLPGEILVPVSRFNEVISEMNTLIERMKLKAPVIGTMADRNTIMLMPYYLTDEKDLLKSTAAMGFAKRLGDIAFNHGGHPVGLGLFFASNLGRFHGKEGATLIRKIKSTLDPHKIMNPGKLVETGTRYDIAIPAFGMSLAMNMLGTLKMALSKDDYGEDLLDKARHGKVEEEED